MLSIKKNMYNNMNRRYVIYRNRIQNSYNLLIIFLAADGGWPPVANFTLVSAVTIDNIKYILNCFSKELLNSTKDHNISFHISPFTTIHNMFIKAE